MKQSRNSVTVTLMISSIVLLLVLQVFWLRGAYRNAAENFRKETNSLFRTTIYAMHDSLIQQGLEPVEKDSMMKFMRPRRYRFDTVVSDGEPPPPDSLFSYMGVVERGAHIEISSTIDKRDSIGRILRPLITKMQMGKEPRRFILRLGPDSLKLDSIEVHFKHALDEAGIQAAFEVLSIKNGKNERVERTTVRPNRFYTSEVVRLSPITRYAVSFAGIE
jgi:two-component system, OmpR family, phosphate regulon sensor histidine kinase PhoR